jgi:hypothetical protein
MARGLRYTHLAITDATGARIQASMSLSGHRLTITINDTHAVYPLRIDPQFQGPGTTYTSPGTTYTSPGTSSTTTVVHQQ